MVLTAKNSKQAESPACTKNRPRTSSQFHDLRTIESATKINNAWQNSFYHVHKASTLRAYVGFLLDCCTNLPLTLGCIGLPRWAYLGGLTYITMAGTRLVKIRVHGDLTVWEVITASLHSLWVQWVNDHSSEVKRSRDHTITPPFWWFWGIDDLKAPVQ